jgi:hypothetical protein
MSSSVVPQPPEQFQLAIDPNPDPSPEDLKRRQATKKAWAAYHGDYQTPFKIEPGQPDPNVKPNRLRQIVDKNVAWIAGQQIEIDVRMAEDDELESSKRKVVRIVPEEAPDTAKMQAALRKVWGSPDDFLTLLTSLIMNGCVDGHAYLKVVWDSDKMDYPRLVALDSGNVYVVADPDDCNRACCYVIEYRASLGTVGGQERIVTKRQVICLMDPDGQARFYGGQDEDDYWTIRNYIRYEQHGAQQSKSSWLPVGGVIDWRYDFPPIVDCMNLPNPNVYYGLPDLSPSLIHLNETLAFIESNINKIIRSNAHPWLFAIGFDPSSLTNEPGRVQGIASPDGKVIALTATGDLASSMKFADDLRADMDEQSRVPAVALGRQESLPKGNMSGIAIDMLFQPLIELVNLKRRLYGSLIRKASAYVLALLGLIEDCDDVEIFLKWPNLLPVDDLAAAQTAQLLLSMGISKQSVFKQLGYDPDEEMAAKKDEDAADMVAQSRGQMAQGATRQPVNFQQAQQQRRLGVGASALGSSLPTGTPATPTLQPNSLQQTAAAPPMMTPVGQ